MMTCFKILSLNINGLYSNLNACLPYIQDHNVDIVALCETKIDDSSDSLFDIEGYHHVSLHRNSRGGGLRGGRQKFQKSKLASQSQTCFVNDGQSKSNISNHKC